MATQTKININNLKNNLELTIKANREALADLWILEESSALDMKEAFDELTKSLSKLKSYGEQMIFNLENCFAGNDEAILIVAKVTSMKKRVAFDWVISFLKGNIECIEKELESKSQLLSSREVE